MLLFLLAQLASACPTEADDVALRAKRALDGLELDQLEPLLADVQCVTGPMPRDGAIALHRLAALSHWADRDLVGVTTHLRATPQDDWMPEDNELARVAKSSQGSAAKRTEALAIPNGWSALADGRPTLVRPLDRAVVFQWLDAENQSRRSAMLLPTEAIPVPPLGVVSALAPPPKVTPWVGEPKNLMLLAGIGAGIAAGSLVGAGLNTRAGLPEPTGGEANPELVRSVTERAKRANTLGYVGQGVGVAAIGLVVTSRIAF